MSRLTSAAGTLAAASLASLALVTAGAAGPASASPAQHDVFVESYDGYQAVSAADNPCGPWAATIHEVRSGEYRIVQAPGGQVADEFHVNGAINGQIELVPDDPARPTYTGSYREKVDGVITGFDEETGDLARVSQYRARARLTGSDGSRLVLTLSGRLTLNAAGEVVVQRDRRTCS